MTPLCARTAQPAFSFSALGLLAPTDPTATSTPTRTPRRIGRSEHRIQHRSRGQRREDAPLPIYLFPGRICAGWAMAYYATGPCCDAVGVHADADAKRCADETSGKAHRDPCRLRPL